MYHGYYNAKFAREAKPKPTDWIIVPSIRVGYYSLVELPTKRQTATQLPNELKELPNRPRMRCFPLPAEVYDSKGRLIKTYPAEQPYEV